MDGRFARLRSFTLAALVAACPAVVCAGKVTLKNGTAFEGDLVPVQGLTDRLIKQAAGPVKTTPILMIDAGYKRIFVSVRQVASRDDDERLRTDDVFTIKQKKGAQTLAVGSVGLPLRVTEFGDHGRRTVTLQTPRGPLDVVQGVTEIAPEYVTVEGITHTWRQGLPTAALPPEQLAKMLHAATDPDDPEDLLAVARFYLKAGLYEAAVGELEATAAKFPDMAARVAEIDRDLRQLRAQKLLAELRRRQAAGQHRLAQSSAERFPTDLGFDAEVLRQVEALRGDYRQGREKADRALLRLGELEARLDDAQRPAVAALRPVLRRELDWDSLPRLEPFLNFADDETMPPAERLALAYSSWVVGPAKAATDLGKALALWRTRQLALEYLETRDPARRGAVLSELAGLEGVGPEALADLVPLLPPWVETPGVAPGEVAVLRTVADVPGWGEPAAEGKPAAARGPVRYAVVLPPEYAPLRNYPMLVALRPAEWSIERTAAFWGLGVDPRGAPTAGPAGRAGYVVVVPEYADAKQTEYGYTAREHEAVLAAIRDAKARFAIDSDRVFLAGHGMGGDATFDFAMSHPDLFAGAVPISGLSRHFTKFYWENAKAVPFYVVNGDLDRSSRETNANEVNQMLKHGYDMTYVEVVGRGYEYYPEELPPVFDWMARLKRAADPKDVDAKILRTCDDRFHWLKAEGLPLAAVAGAVVNPGPGGRIQPMPLVASITPGNSVVVKQSAASRHVIRLNAGLIDFGRRVEVRVGSRRLFNDFVEPEAEALLDDLAANGDRQRLYPVRIVVP